MDSGKNSWVIINKLQAYKKKFYLNLMLKGSLLALALLFTAFLFFNTLEYSLRLNSVVRAILFFSFLTLSIYCLIRMVFIPAIKIFVDKARISNEEAADQIGQYFPEIRDKLLNTLQLSALTDAQNDLVTASIEQRTNEINNFTFTTAVDIRDNIRYIKYVAAPLAIGLILLLWIPQIYTEGTERIVNYQKDYSAVAPFSFHLTNSTLLAFKNEDFTIQARLEGEAVPLSAYVNMNGRKMKMHPEGNGVFSFPVKKIQTDLEFNLEAGGFGSTDYTVKMVNRPGLKNFKVDLQYPRYINKRNESLNSAGNLLIPEGTKVSWLFDAVHTEEMFIRFSDNERQKISQDTDNQLFNYESVFKSPTEYEVSLGNEYSENRDPIQYTIDVIKDEYPEIDLNQFQDTTLFSFIVLGGNISDDYGFSRLELFYKSMDGSSYESRKIPFDKKQASQSYYYRWNLDELELEEGDEMEYYIQVWDNDGVNGAKASKTGTYSLQIPSSEVISEKLAKESQATENQIDKSLEKAQDLKEEIEEMEKKLKEKRELNWQDEKSIEDILEKRKELEEEIEKLKEQNEEFLKQQERFNNPNESLQKKAEQLQELMEELLDEETRKLYEELQRLLDENLDMNEVQELLDDLKKNESNLEKELERTLELFKQLQVENKLEELVNKMEELAQEQEELSEKTGDRKQDMEEILEEQEKLNESFNEIQESKEEIEELNQELDSPKPIQDTSEEEESIQQEQKESKENLENKKRKPAQKSQKNASEQMKKLSEKLQQMQMGMEMQTLNENLDQLREIVDNLIKLSKDQENLMNEFEEVNQSDPRFIQLSQDQLKLKDDARVIEDSLLALANRVFQIQSFVTREVAEMNSNMDEAVDAIKDREQAKAVGKQHFAMTSMNNLALLLDDVLQQMQQQMADAMGNPKNGSKKGELPSLSELQQQLNEQIKDLQKSGKKGRALSEELAKMAAQQEKLRQMLQEMEQMQDGEKGKEAGGNEIGEKMEETELDLVNKQITRETIQRQEEILTRLLEFENAMRERELDEQRKGETAKDYDKQIPREFEEYFKAKEKEIELLKTVPPKLNPYYKKEVNEYFKRISNQ